MNYRKITMKWSFPYNSFVKLSLKGITVPLGTASLGAMFGFISIRNKSRSTLANPLFALLILGQDLI